MKFLKLTGLGLVVLVAVLAAASYALPRHVEVERSIIVAAEPDEIFPYLNSFKNFNEWSPWAQHDPDTVYIFSGPEFGAGAKMDWTSEHPQVGDGSQEITESEQYKIVRTRLDFGPDGTAEGFYKLARVDEGTQVIWGFETDMGNNPIGRYMGLLMDKWIGGDFAKGLDRLKALVEDGAV